METTIHFKVIALAGELQRAGIIMEDVELPEPSRAATLADSVDGQLGDAMDEAQTKAAAALLQVCGLRCTAFQ